RRMGENIYGCSNRVQKPDYQPKAYGSGGCGAPPRFYRTLVMLGMGTQHSATPGLGGTQSVQNGAHAGAWAPSESPYHGRAIKAPDPTSASAPGAGRRCTGSAP